MTAAERRQWERAKRGPGRPRRGQGAVAISLTVERSLLDAADALAKRAGITRAALFERGLRALVARGRKMAG